MEVLTAVERSVGLVRMVEYPGGQAVVQSTVVVPVRSHGVVPTPIVPTVPLQRAIGRHIAFS